MNKQFWAMITGREPADVRIDNVCIVDVFSGTIREGSVSMGMGRILGFGPFEAKTVVDGKGRWLLPGLIDGHVHIESSMLCPARFAELVLPFGTTTVVADPHEIANVAGLDGLEYMLNQTGGLPLDVYFVLPSCVPATGLDESGAVLGSDDLKPYYGRLHFWRGIERPFTDGKEIFYVIPCLEKHGQYPVCLGARFLSYAFRHFFLYHAHDLRDGFLIVKYLEEYL